MMKLHLNKGYCLTLENYCTFPELEIGERGSIYKKGFCDDIMVLQWNDESKTKSTKFVSLLSTIHNGDLIGSGKKLIDRLT